MSYESLLAQRLVPYVAGEQPKQQKMIKLNTNEHPYGCSPSVKTAIQKEMDQLRLYPDTEATALREAIAETEGLKAEEIFCGNGSDEVLAFSFAAFFAGKDVYAPEITYSFYPVYANLFGVHYHPCVMNLDFSVNLDALKQGGPIVLANPNAPTSLWLDTDQLESLALYTQSIDEILLIDEAYAAFAPETAKRLLCMDNVLIVRTFSKSHGLAGLRVGYAMGNPRLINALRRVRDSFNSYPVDRLAQAGARAAVLDTEWTHSTVNRIIQTRDHCYMTWKASGFCVMKSATNFLFIKVASDDAAPVQRRLRENGILVRHFNSEKLRPYLRITVGTEDDMEQVTRELLNMEC